MRQGKDKSETSSASFSESHLPPFVVVLLPLPCHKQTNSSFSALNIPPACIGSCPVISVPPHRCPPTRKTAYTYTYPEGLGRSIYPSCIFCRTLCHVPRARRIPLFPACFYGWTPWTLLDRLGSLDSSVCNILLCSLPLVELVKYFCIGVFI
jgi:hypothetical protein